MIENPPARIFADRTEACRTLAAEVAALIRSINAAGRPAVLGLATGRTPLPFYSELIRLHRAGELSFARAATFNLDEYLGLPGDHPQSYRSFMRREFFAHVDLPAESIHIPNDNPTDISAHCDAYEKAIRDAGGIDFQLLGIGRSGHIGFNEPGSPRDSRTRQVELGPLTREDAAASFGGLDRVPTHAISMGCGTILEARKIALLAWGSGKAGIVKEALTGSVTDRVSASFLQDHPDATFYLDAEAGAEL